MSIMLDQSEINEAAALCITAANDESKNKVAIYTHGKGIEIMNDEFKTNRSYYHNNEGKKLFFTPKCLNGVQNKIP